MTPVSIFALSDPLSLLVGVGVLIVTGSRRNSSTPSPDRDSDAFFSTLELKPARSGLHRGTDGGENCVVSARSGVLKCS